VSAGSRALTSFVAENQQALTRFAYVLCGDRYVAEDLVQEVFTAMFARFGDWLTLEHPFAYARTAIVHAHVSRGRRRWTRERPAGLAMIEGRGVVETESPLKDRMWTALGALPERQRAALVLRYYADLSDADIAAALECRVGSVSSAISRATARLRRDATLAEEDR